MAMHGKGGANIDVVVDHSTTTSKLVCTPYTKPQIQMPAFTQIFYKCSKNYSPGILGKCLEVLRISPAFMFSVASMYLSLSPTATKAM